MKYLSESAFASALVLALLSTPYAVAAGSSRGTATAGVGAGSMGNSNQIGTASPAVTASNTGAAAGVGAVRGSGTSGRYGDDRTNALNKGTNSGANSDVNRFRGARPPGQ
jgi:hypothetical protein